MKYRLHGRYGKIEHAGAFPTRREADLRARAVRDWIAQAKDPRVELARVFQPSMTLLEAGEAWLRTRRSISPQTARDYRRRIVRLDEQIGMEVGRITVTDIDGWLTKLAAERKPGTVKEYLVLLRAVLDFAGVDPNPARDRRIEPPRRQRRVIQPPDADTTLRVLARANPKHRALLVLIEQTGLRVGEAVALEPRHVDTTNRRLLVEHSKTRHPRWVPLPAWLADQMPTLGRASRNVIFNTLKTACDDTGTKPFGPHMLRHRRCSLWHLQHVPVVQAAAWAGHSPAVHLNTYAHVMPITEIPAQSLASLLR